MPRYFFNLHNDVDTVDEEGVELANLDAARGYATREARIMAGHSVQTHGRLTMHHRIDIVDRDGTLLSTIRFRDAIDVQ